MKIKFILLIVLFSLSIQSRANIKIDLAYHQLALGEPAESTNAIHATKISLILGGVTSANVVSIAQPSISSGNWYSDGWILTVSILVNLGLVILVLIFKSKLNAQIKTKGEFEKLERKLKKTENERNNFHQENIGHGEVIDGLKHEISELKKASIPPIEVSELRTEQQTVEQDVVQSPRYISAKCLNEGGQYYLKESKVTNQTTPYVIFEENSDHYFKFDDRNKDGRNNAFNFHNIYFEGYCDGINIRTDMHTSFEVVDNSVGKLQKVGDTYLVVERIKVNYLSGR